MYGLGSGSLVLASSESRPELDVVVAELLRAIDGAASASDQLAALSIRTLSAGLELVAGRRRAETGDLVELRGLVEAAATARSSSRLHFGGGWTREPVRSPALLSLAVVQLVVNAERHAGASELTIDVEHGPTVRLSWPSADAGFNGPKINTSRRPDRRERWGMGFVRQAVDALGGVVSDVYIYAPGKSAVSIGLGTSRLSLPLACVTAGRVQQSTQTWDEETGVRRGGVADGAVATVLAQAVVQAGTVASCEGFAARNAGDRAWVMLAPHSDIDRARDVVRGLQHEKALLSAPEPFATRAHALALLLAGALGDRGEHSSPEVFARDFPISCAALGCPAPAWPDVLDLPDPRLTAYLLSEVGQQLIEVGGGLALRLRPETAGHPLVPVLAAADGVLQLSG